MTFIAAANTAIAVLAEASKKEEFDPTKVTPGVSGFVVIAVLAVALCFLGFDLVRRLRKAKYRAEIQTELAAEIAERDAKLKSEASGNTDTQTEHDR